MRNPDHLYASARGLIFLDSLMMGSGPGPEFPQQCLDVQQYLDVALSCQCCFAHDLYRHARLDDHETVSAGEAVMGPVKGPGQLLRRP